MNDSRVLEILLRRASLRRLTVLPSFLGPEDNGGYDFCGFRLLICEFGLSNGTSAGVDMTGRPVSRVSRTDFDLRKRLSIMIAGEWMFIFKIQK